MEGMCRSFAFDSCISGIRFSSSFFCNWWICKAEIIYTPRSLRISKLTGHDDLWGLHAHETFKHLLQCLSFLSGDRQETPIQESCHGRLLVCDRDNGAFWRWRRLIQLPLNQGLLFPFNAQAILLEPQALL